MAMMLVVLTQSSPVHGVISTSPRAKTGGLLLSMILSRRNSELTQDIGTLAAARQRSVCRDRLRDARLRPLW